MFVNIIFRRTSINLSGDESTENVYMWLHYNFRIRSGDLISVDRIIILSVLVRYVEDD